VAILHDIKPMLLIISVLKRENKLHAIVQVIVARALQSDIVWLRSIKELIIHTADRY
jgi:hypothetical protein